jgi:hypothetical protein
MTHAGGRPRVDPEAVAEAIRLRELGTTWPMIEVMLRISRRSVLRETARQSTGQNSSEHEEGIGGRT